MTGPNTTWTFNAGSPIINLNYGIVFLGSAKDYGGHAADVLSSLNALLGNTSVVGGLTQYINTSAGNSSPSATSICASSTTPTYYPTVPPLTTPWNRSTLQEVATTIAENGGTPYLTTSPVISSAGVTTPVLILILPPGVSFNDENLLPGHTSLGVHGRFDNISYGKNTGRVYFCASEWVCKGTSGFPPAWEGWQNTCANVFKEIAQCWTNPDVNDLPTDASDLVPATFNGTARWFTNQWQTPPTSTYPWAEIGNLNRIQIVYASSVPVRYGMVSGNPMQVFWSELTASPVNPTGSAILPGPYCPTDFTSVPSVTSIDPLTEIAIPPLPQVTITGFGLSQVAAVYFGGSPGTISTVTSNQIVVTPPNAAAGPATITLVLNDKTTENIGTFTYTQ